jgi:hypothetical protein
MTSNLVPNANFIGPHEERELELMKLGTKPLSMFVEPIPSEYEFFDEEQFDALVERGTFVKSVRIENVPTPNGDQEIRRTCYAQASESWRIPAMLLTLDVYRSLGPGIRPDLERITGLLLGYDREDIEKYVESKRR